MPDRVDIGVAHRRDRQIDCPQWTQGPPCWRLPHRLHHLLLLAIRLRARNEISIRISRLPSLSPLLSGRHTRTFLRLQDQVCCLYAPFQRNSRRRSSESDSDTNETINNWPAHIWIAFIIRGPRCIWEMISASQLRKEIMLGMCVRPVYHQSCITSYGLMS